MNIFVDTETTGLLDENCHIVSMCWIVCQHEKIIDQSYFLVKPDGFKIPAKSTAIHGITQIEAENKGHSIRLVLSKFEKALESCKSIVAHNVDFDVSVILKECQAYNLTSLIELINARHAICTMRKGCEVMNQKKWPKLADLYMYLYDEPITNAHNALSDTLHCLKCYLKMFPKDPSIFFFKDKFVTLTSEQQSIVYESNDKHMQIVAGPGSGKTLTTLTRVKHLLDTEACQAEQIILTTFTCDAANELKNRLYDMLGYRPAVRIGTIDSISKFFLGSNSQMKHVSEYSYEFLEKIDLLTPALKDYKYLFVDEFQDINQVQFEIINRFYKMGLILYVVGDDAQNIYSFRGSDVKYMIEFNTHFPTASRYFLTHNFRSSKQIVDFSNNSLEKHQYKIPKTMISHRQGDKPKIHYCVNSRQQAIFIVKRIKYYFKQGQTDIAVLCPLSQPLYLIEELLTKEELPNVCLEGKHETRIHRKKGFVCLSTIHKSKGLEWDTVFLVHMDDEIIPRVKSIKELEDARRVFYVGITRPKDNLYITYTKNPSRYLVELSSDLYQSNKELLAGHKASSYITTITEKNTSFDVVTLITSLEKSTDIIKHVRINLFPSVTEKLKQYATSSSYGDYVIRENLKAEFNDVLKLMILQYIKPVDLSDLLAHIILDPKRYSAYKKGENIHVKNEIEEIAREFNVPEERVKIYCRDDNDPYIRVKLETEIKNFSQQSDDLFSKFKAAWNIVLYNRVITEGRRKHLFKEYNYRALYEEFCTIYNKCTPELIQGETVLKIKKGNMYDTVDIVGDDCIGTIICTTNIEFGVLVRLFVQSFILNKNHIWILNPLTCILREYKLESTAESLVEYLASQEIV